MILPLVLLVVVCLFDGVHSSSCPCSNTALCAPLNIPPVWPTEYYGFVTTANLSANPIDFSVATTLAMFFDLSTMGEFLCAAHEAGVRVVINTPVPADLTNATARSEAVATALQLIQDNWADGVNVDYESPANGTLAAAFTTFALELYSAVKAANPNYQMSIDVAWSADCIDGRCYDYAGLSKASDFLFVMVYDTRSQTGNPPCYAGANSPIQAVMSGIESYLELGIPSNKLVLGLPWYGYLYPCITPNTTGPCQIESVPFRGSPCSDAAGGQENFDYIVNLPSTHITYSQYDTPTQTPWLFYYEDNVMYQVWFDDIQSLTTKIFAVRPYGLLGVGMWQADAAGPMFYQDFWAILEVLRMDTTTSTTSTTST